MTNKNKKETNMNYQNGKIYKIESMMGEKIYIGSTTKQYLSQRLAKHKIDYRQWKQNKPGLSNMTSYELFDEYGLDNCMITLLENFPCESKDELRAKEAYYIRILQCVNKCVPGRTKAQYKNDHRDEIRTKDLEFYHKNKERINKKRSEKVTCECGSIVSVRHKYRHLTSKKHQAFIQSSDLPVVVEV